MGPGPSEVPDSVLRALGQPTLGHLDPAFVEVMNQVQDMLRTAWGTRNDATFALSATGTSGMEACLTNLLEPGDRALVGVNGVFGSRMVEVAERAGAEVTRVDQTWGKPLDPSAFRLAAKGRRHKVVAMVHAETSTGVRNDLGPIRSVANEYGALFVADCVTSLGGMPVDLDKNGVDAAYSASQKCLSAPSGTAPISLSERALAAIAKRTTPIRSWYLDLNLLRNYWGGERKYHHTAPSNLFYSLHEALRLALEEGLPNRYARHQLHGRALWAGLTAMGLQMPVATALRLPQLTLVAVPEGVDAKSVMAELRDVYGIEIGGGLGPFAGKAWRIGLMGGASQRPHVVRLLAALHSTLLRQGFTPADHGVAAAEAVYGA
ncbi:MAG: alanine-glyoxylate transaminase/serine-glyoxylate transaminase/serine-pyruvate transaminase [Myxococcota bacterium]|jgi:alanine-glyoxylate transaminase/serine-glyoxylate transaminase/serine-pyruvate transaminase